MFRWHDHRAHWMSPIPAPEVQAAPDVERVVRTDTLSMQIDGRVVDATIRVTWLPKPDRLIWLVAASVLAAIVAATFVLVRGADRYLPATVVVASVAVLLASGGSGVRVVISAVAIAAAIAGLLARQRLVSVGAAVITSLLASDAAGGVRARTARRLGVGADPTRCDRRRLRFGHRRRRGVDRRRVEPIAGPVIDIAEREGDGPWRPLAIILNLGIVGIVGRSPRLAGVRHRPGRRVVRRARAGPGPCRAGVHRPDRWCRARHIAVGGDARVHRTGRGRSRCGLAVRRCGKSGGGRRCRASRRPKHCRAGVAPELEPGSYVVDWRVVSADSRPIQGAFTFQVGSVSDWRPARSRASSAAGTPVSVSSIGLDVTRGLVTAAIAVVFGGLLVIGLGIVEASRRNRRIVADRRGDRSRRRTVAAAVRSRLRQRSSDSA